MPESVMQCTCPHCGGRMGLKDRGLIGKKIRCLKCQKPFLVEDPDDLDAEEPERVRKKNSPATGADARRTEPEEEIDELEVIPPARKRKPIDDADEDRPRKRKKRKQKSRALLWILLGGGGAVAVAAVVLVVVLGLKFVGRVSLPAGWQEIHSAAGRFQAAMPAPWIERSRTMPSPAGSVTDFQYLYEVAGADLSYSITYADFSPAQLQKVSLEKIIDAGRDAIAQKFGGSVETDRPIDLDGRRGREIVVHVPGRGKFLMRYYIADTRLYSLSLAGSKAALDAKEARAFFGSFRFTDKTK